MDYKKRAKTSQTECLFYCDCGKKYVNRQNLHRHKKVCNYNESCKIITNKNNALENTREKELYEENKILVYDSFNIEEVEQPTTPKGINKYLFKIMKEATNSENDIFKNY